MLEMFTPQILIWFCVMLAGLVYSILVLTGTIYSSDVNKNKHRIQASTVDADEFNDAVELKGDWAASTNTPTLADGTGGTGDFYIATDGGTVDFGSGNITFALGDKVYYTGSVWAKQDFSATASEIPIVDTGGLITATDVEGALQENRTAIDAIEDNVITSTDGSIGVAGTVGADDQVIETAFSVVGLANRSIDAEDLASNVNALGASLVGIEDPTTKITATTVEGAVVENRTALDLNTTHRTSDGKNHSDVVGNTARTIGITPGVGAVADTMKFLEGPSNGAFGVSVKPVDDLTGDRTMLMPDADVSLADVGLNNDFRASKNAASGVCPLDAGSKVPVANLPASTFLYLGNWAASTNTPTLANGSGTNGDTYVSTDGGTVDFGAGGITFLAGDYAVYNGSIWEKSINSNAVQSVHSRSGIVVAATNDYTWAQVDKTVSDIADLTTKNHTDLTAGDGTDHGNVVLNDTHRALDGPKHNMADVNLFGNSPAHEDLMAALWDDGARGIGIGASGNIYSMYNYQTGGPSEGFQHIENTEGTFTGGTSVTDGTWHINVNVDETGIQDVSVIMSTDDITALVTALDTALGLLGTTAGCSLADGYIRVTSDSTGTTSKIAMTEGSGGSGGLIAMLTALGSTTAIINTAVDGETVGTRVRSVQLT